MTSLRRAREVDLVEAVKYMHLKETAGIVEPENTTWDEESWNMQKVKEFALAKPGRCIVLLEGFAVDATEYLAEHVSFFLASDFKEETLISHNSLEGRASFGNIPCG